MRWQGLSYPSFGLLAVLLLFSCCQSNIHIQECDVCSSLSCRVNGKLFVPQGRGSILNAATQGDKNLQVNAYDNDSFIGLGLILADSIRVGTYPLTSPLGVGVGLYSDGYRASDYSTDANNRGELTITKLEYGIRPVMEGTFRFDCINKVTQQRIVITEGNFRLFFGRAN